MNAPLEVAYRAAARWIDGLDRRPVAATATMAELRARFGGAMPVKGSDPGEVVASLVRDADDGLSASSGGRFFAWVIGGGLESALAADWLVTAWDQNAGMYGTSPSASVIEETAGNWLKDLFDLPGDASFAFVSGCQMAHFTALAAARGAVLMRANWNVDRDGLSGAPRIKLFASEHHHVTIDRAVRYLGLGGNAVELLPAAPNGCLEPAVLERALSEHGGPKIVVLNAADLNIGMSDPFNELIPLAHAAGAWVHVDGAFGLFARASRKYRHLVEGVEHADSWATDGHKWLNVPYDCGIAIIRDRDAHRTAMTSSAAYVTPTSAARDQFEWNPEYSRRARGIPVYAALRELGRNGVEALVDRCCRHCAAIVDGIGALPGAVVVARPVLNQGLLRFTRAGNGPAEDDAFTEKVIGKINATGEAFFSGTLWRGRRVMRVSVVNWRTSERDIARTVEAARSILATEFAEAV
jgi:glutamate/tyrosine decarboxylase-like PLP-dependent enzyme